MTTPLIDNSDQRFSASLDNLESGESPRRRQAMAYLEKLGGLRAFQVAAALTGDADLVVAATARRICSEASKKGLILRTRLQAQPLAQTVSIKNFYQLLDEVVFIIRRNLTGVVLDSFLFSIPKFVLVTVFFLCPYYAALAELVAQAWVIIPAVVLYELFWRPLVWSSTGMAILAGFPENAMRRQSSRLSGSALYWQMLRSGLVEAVFYVFLLMAVFAWYLGFARDLWPAAIAFIVWFAIWVDSSLTMAAKILVAKPGAQLLWRSGYIGHFWLSLKFGVVLACLYFVITGSAVSLLWLFGLDNVLDWPRLFLSGFVIAADALLDPFVMGYRILMARLALDPRCL
ncbi:MAG: hypothetical protein CVV42_02170 [Candidatus Riflebacteria bacterium HGW-Riflebacteria-2]|jgi:hypothetical protein|nr:MAG: hypothetical protein CVV42_02170 [Candidatus Riflebacteria bacterium HGW-Riflebacteria-2]